MKLLELYWFLFFWAIGDVYGSVASPQNYRDFFMVHLDKEPRSFDESLNMPDVPGSSDLKHILLRIGRNSKSWEKLGFGIQDFSRYMDEDPILRTKQKPYKTREEDILSLETTDID